MLAVAFSIHAFAQSPKFPVISGQVLDSSSAAVVGAEIQIRIPGGATVAHLVSDSAGRFRGSTVPPGTYEVVVSHPGFQQTDKALTVAANGGPTLTVTLPVSSMNTSVTVTGKSSLITETPTGQTQVEVSREDFKNAPAVTIADALALVPGVTFTGGNGPRDVSISIRGSNERQAYGLRNLQVFEDGFPVTQPDGTARGDLMDPHAYSGFDVIEGPSGALYGNYATGGAINFHSRSGSEIQGLEVGADFGSFNYFNDFATFGVGSVKYQATVFLSNVRGDQATDNNQFNTTTANVSATAEVSSKDRLTFKFINNDLNTKLPIRLSLAQYRLNPFQQGCEAYTTAAASTGCAFISVYTNGFNGSRISETAQQAGLGRQDRRTIVGARWEHDLTDNTLVRGQFVFDNRDTNQPTSALYYRGPYPSFNVTGEVLRRTERTTTYGGYFFNRENLNTIVNNLAPGDATEGGLNQTVYGTHLNTGVRGREEFRFAQKWVLVAGLGGEFTGLHGLSTAYNYPTTTAATPSLTQTAGDRTFFNVAPEVALQYQPSSSIRLHTRFGTGYGTPQVTQLFITPQGTPGNNTAIQSQYLYGIDFGADWTLGRTLQATATGFYEWFHNEQVTQSPGVSLQSYTFNAPRSEHRGVEVGLDWHPLPNHLPGARLRTSYLYDNQIYTNYSEQLTSGALTASFNRSGNRIPGVQPNFLNARLQYDQPSGRLQGLGAYIEANWRDNYFLDNANFLTAPGYTLLNLSTHYDPPEGHGFSSRLRFYFDIQNLANRTYVDTAGNITNTLNALGQQNGASVLVNSGGSIYAGTPRASYGGVRVRF